MPSTAGRRAGAAMSRADALGAVAAGAHRQRRRARLDRAERRPDRRRDPGALPRDRRPELARDRAAQPARRAATPISPSMAGSPATARHGVPGPETLWTAEGGELTATDPVTPALGQRPGPDLRQAGRARPATTCSPSSASVTNTTDKPVTLYPYGLISRWGTPHTLGYYILHEGPIGVLGGQLEEWKYKNVAEEGQGRVRQHRRLARHHRQVLAGLAGAASRTDAQGRLPARGRGRPLPGRLSRRRHHGGPGPDGRDHRPAVRRRQGGDAARPLPRRLQHPAVRPRGRFRLVLLPDQADLLRPALDPRRRRQLRHRDPDPDAAGQGRCSSRSPTSPTGPWRR